MDTRSIFAGLTIGLLIGAAISFLVSVPALTRIDYLQNQVTNLESQTLVRNAQIGNLTAWITQQNAEIANLTATIGWLRAQIPPERKGEYNLVATYKGQSSGSTDFFYLDEPDIMVVWNWTSSQPQYAKFYLSLWKQNASIYSASWLNLPRNGSVFVHNVQTAYYYLDTNVLNLDSWTVSVYKWVPA